VVTVALASSASIEGAHHSRRFGGYPRKKKRLHMNGALEVFEDF
jgi:hypothetical protein